MSNMFIHYGNHAQQAAHAVLTPLLARMSVPRHVVLKPNLVVAKPAHTGATTHAEVAEGVILALQEWGVSHISIMEGAWVGDSTRKAFQAGGWDKLAQRYNCELLDTKADDTLKIDVPQGDLTLQVCRSVWQADMLINLPVLKGHCQTNMTCALKNLKGCIPDSEKRRFHTLGLHRPIAALAAAFARHMPVLTVVDALCGDLSFEEGGHPVVMDRIYAGADMVQLDAYGAQLMGLPLSDVRYIQLAQEYGAGSTTLEADDIQVIGGAPDQQEFTTPPDLRVFRNQNIHAKDACSACQGALVHALYRLSQEGWRPVEPIAVGQGWQGQQQPGMGVGKCCAGFARHVPGCPPTAQAIMRLLDEQ